MAQASVTNIDAGRWVQARYDFAVHGGAVGDIGLRVRLPKGAIIVNSFARVLTAFDSGGSATVAVKVESAADIFTASAMDGAVWGATGFHLGKARYVPAIDLGSGDGSDTAIDDSAAAAYVATTVERQLTLTVAVAALTAGKADICLQYIETEVG